MEHGNGAPDTPLHTLIPLADFRAILGIDDREDCLDFASVRNQGSEFLHGKNSTHLFQPPSLAAFCLITATYTIEQYCKRRFYRKKHIDYLTFAGEHIFTLREYPVGKVLSVHAARAGAALQGEAVFTPENLVDPKHYYCLPDEGIHEDSDLWSAPFSLVLRPPYRLAKEEMGIKVRYLAGYAPGKAPPDLASACLELAAWNMSRYRGRRIGMTGNVRGSGKDGEHLESSMPENVRQLLEPYRRRTI
ncbi:MAG: hypothetical protein LBU19_04065 [Treponema sp.]|jgi:hypothetical protein|nr:hypothetical protein [Treponema sp.]